MSKRGKGRFGHSAKYEDIVGFKEKPDELCLTKAEMRRLDKFIRDFVPLHKKGVHGGW